MNIILEDLNTCINKLTYETFLPEELDTENGISETQHVDISAKLATAKKKKNMFLFLCEISVTGKNEEYILRNFDIDIFFVYSYKNFEEYKNFSNREKNSINQSVLLECLCRIEEIINCNTKIGQVDPLSIQDDIEILKDNINKDSFKCDIQIDKDD
ncbi:hypothetical protein [Enterococcus sp. AZ126]|uniref:hypothetical protein n=1 Tax=Enterococcus sp. AZ126 TaxID=2774635 RepID=UPI003F22093B